uniref:Putative c2h2-type zn-finger protein n=1 Tax=Lutzomyia longipalpis TaxID=7200 RepID=A0A1B0C7Z7_LUTLO
MEIEAEPDNLLVDYSIVKEEYTIQEQESPPEAHSLCPKEEPEQDYIIPEEVVERVKVKEEPEEYPSEEDEAIKEEVEDVEEPEVKDKEEEQQKETVQFVIQELRERKHECPVCHKFFFTLGHKNEHLKIHSSERKFQCPNCPMAFPCGSRLKKHSMVHENKDIPCNICEKRFKNLRSLGLHMELHSNTEKIECELCQKMLKTTRSLKEHYLRIHCSETANKIYNCDECGKEFGLKNHLKKHMVTHSQEKNYVCKVCSKRYKHPYDFRRHEETCSLETKDPFICNICGKDFESIRGLVAHRKKHIRVLTGCYYCERKFSYSNNLIDHIKDAHRGLPTKKVGDGFVSCSVCYGIFESLDVLKKHVRIHQNDPQTDPQTELQRQPQAEPQQDPQRESQPELQRQPQEPLLHPQAELQLKPQLELLPQREPQPELQLEPQPEPQSQPQANLQQSSSDVISNEAIRDFSDFLSGFLRGIPDIPFNPERAATEPKDDE